MISSIGGNASAYPVNMASAQPAKTRTAESAEQKAFQRLDVNHDGGIDPTELAEFTSASTGAGVSFQTSDTDGNGAIGSAEFVAGETSLFDALRSQLTAEGDAARSDADRPAKADDSAAKRLASEAESGTLGTIALLLENYRNTAAGEAAAPALAVSA